MLRAPITQPIEAISSVALVSDGSFAHGFADRAEPRLLEAAGECAQRKAGRQSLHDRRLHALERILIDWRRRCLRGAVVRGDREKQNQQQERLSTINSVSHPSFPSWILCATSPTELPTMTAVT